MCCLHTPNIVTLVPNSFSSDVAELLQQNTQFLLAGPLKHRQEGYATPKHTSVCWQRVGRWARHTPQSCTVDLVEKFIDVGQSAIR